MKHTLLFLGIFSLAGYYGCIPSPSPKTPAVVVVPNVGTSWTFQNTYLDSTGAVKKTDTSTRVIVATNMTYQGDSDVVMLVETYTSTKTTDTTYIRYLSTGDISRLSWPLIAPKISPEWLLIPYHSHAAKSYAWAGNLGSTIYNHDTISFSTSYVAQESDTVAGTVYTASVVSTNIWQNISGPSKDSLIVTTQTNSFIPSLGIFGNRGATYSQIKGVQVWREQQVLIAVNIR